MVIIIQGSKTDADWSNKISSNLAKYALTHRIITASAHKTPEFLLNILQKYENNKEQLIYICVAGRSNALGGFVDANTRFPVINCPPPSDKFAGLDVLSSLRMPSGVASLTVLDADNAALACAKIIALSNMKISAKIINVQKKNREDIIATQNIND